MPLKSNVAQFMISPAVTGVINEFSGFQIQVATGKEIVVRVLQNLMGAASQMAVEVRAAATITTNPVAIVHSGVFAPEGYVLASTIVKGTSGVSGPDADSGRLAAAVASPILIDDLVVPAGKFLVIRVVTAGASFSGLLIFEEREAAHGADGSA